MVLAQRQKYRSVEQYRKPRDKSMHLWTPYLLQRRLRKVHTGTDLGCIQLLMFTPLRRIHALNMHLIRHIDRTGLLQLKRGQAHRHRSVMIAPDHRQYTEHHQTACQYFRTAGRYGVCIRAGNRQRRAVRLVCKAARRQYL